MSFRQATTAVLLFACSWLISSCAKKNERQITISGSSTVLPIVDQLAESYQAQHKDIQIIRNAGGSGTGFQEVINRKIHIGMMSRAITENEKQNAKETLKSHTIAIDAVAVALSSEIYDSGITALSLADVRKIYEGQITNWQELGGPDRQIVVIDKEKSRGTRHVFMKAVFGDSHAEAPGATVVSGSNNEERKHITNSDAAIGMLSFAWLNDNVKGVSIKTADGIIKPAISEVVSGRYPISRKLILVTAGNVNSDTKDFLEYCLSEAAKSTIKEKGYITLR